jgi:hypothetical protein
MGTRGLISYDIAENEHKLKAPDETPLENTEEKKADIQNITMCEESDDNIHTSILAEIAVPRDPIESKLDPKAPLA